MANHESGLDIGAAVPSPEAHELLMASAEAREQRRAIKLGRLAVYMGITRRGRIRPESPEQNMLPLFDSLTGQEFNELQMAYYRDTEPLFDQFTYGYHVEPDKRSIDLYVSGSRDQASENAKKLKGLLGTPDYAIVRREMQRQTQHRADQLCRETHTNAYTAMIREYSLQTTLALIKTGEALDTTAALFAADAINDFGFGATANQDRLHLRRNFGYKISFIGESAVDDPEVLRQNVDLMELVVREQKRRLNFWGPRAEAAQLYLGHHRLTTATREAQAELEAEIDRQAAIRDNIVSDES